MLRTGQRLRTDISAEGVKTQTSFDALGRPASVTRTSAGGVAGTTIYYYYEARTGGGTVQRIRQGTAAATIPVSEQATDNAGRVVSSKDGTGLTTSTAYTVSGANAVTTETLPSGATRITTTGPDGETISISGTAVIAQTFENKIIVQTGDTVTTPSWINTSHQAVTGAADLTAMTKRRLLRALVMYRQLLGLAGRPRVREDGVMVRRGVSARVLKKLESSVGIKREQLLKRVRHFTDGVILGSREFINSWFERNRSWFRGASAEKRKTGARRITAGWRKLFSLRQLSE